MNERVRKLSNADVLAGELIELLRDEHPGIVEQWDAEIAQAMLDEEESWEGPDYYTATGALYWLDSEVQIAAKHLAHEPSELETAILEYCTASALVLRGFIKGETNE